MSARLGVFHRRRVSTALLLHSPPPVQHHLASSSSSLLLPSSVHNNSRFASSTSTTTTSSSPAWRQVAPPSSSSSSPPSSSSLACEVHAYARNAGAAPARLPGALLDRLDRANLRSFSPDELADVYHSLAAINHRAGHVLDRMADELVRRGARQQLHDGDDKGVLLFSSPASLARTLSSLAALDYRGSAAFATLLQHQVEQHLAAADFTPHELVDVLHAAARLNLTSSARLLADEVVRRRHQLAPTQLAQSVTSLAKLDALPSSSAAVLDDVITPTAASALAPHDLAQLVWGLVKSTASPTALAACASAVASNPRLLSQLSPPDLAAMAWGFAQTPHEQHAADFALALRADLKTSPRSSSLPKFSNADLVTLLLSAGKLGAVGGGHTAALAFVSEVVGRRNLKQFDLALLLDASRALCLLSPNNSNSYSYSHGLRAVAEEVATRDWEEHHSNRGEDLMAIAALFSKAKLRLPGKFSLLRSHVRGMALSELAVLTDPVVLLGLHHPLQDAITQEWVNRSSTSSTGASFDALSQDEIARVLHGFVRLPFYNRAVCTQLAKCIQGGEPVVAAYAVRSLADLKHGQGLDVDSLLKNVEAYSPASLARLVWSSSELLDEFAPHHRLHLARELTARAGSSSASFPPRSVAAILQSLAKWTKSEEVGAAAAVAANALVLSADLGQFGWRDLADCMGGLAKLHHHEPTNAAARVVSREIERRGAQEFDTGSLVYVLESMAAFTDTTAAATMVVASELASARLSQLSPFQLSAALTSLARLHKEEEEDGMLMHELCTELTMRRPAASALDLVMGLAAMAQAKAPCRPLFDRVVSELKDDAASEYVPGIVSSAVKLGYTDMGLFRRLLSSSSSSSLGALSPSALANLMWALAKTNRFPGDVFEHVLAELLNHQDLRSFPPSALSMMLWVCSREELAPLVMTAGGRGGQLVARLWGEIESRSSHSRTGGLAQFNGQDLAHVAHSLAVLQEQSSSPPSVVQQQRLALFDRIGREVAGRGSIVDPHAVASLSRSFARARVLHPRLMQWTCRSDRDLTGYSAQDLAMVMQSCARLGFRDFKFANRVAEECTRRLTTQPGLSEFSAQSLVNLLYSFASLDVLVGPRVVDLFQLSPPMATAAAAGRCFAPERTFQVAQQLYQTRMAWGRRRPCALLDALTGTAGDGDGDNWVEQMVRQYPPANSQTEAHQLFAALLARQAGVPEFEEQAQVGQLAVDFCFSGVRCVVELDGPLRFLGNVPHKLTGTAAFKHRLLQCKGYTVFSVPLLEFQRANPVEQAQIAGRIGNKIKDQAVRNAQAEEKNRQITAQLRATRMAAAAPTAIDNSVT